MEEKFQESKVEGRNAVLEAFRSGRVVDKLFVLERCEDGPVRTILREAKKHDTMVPVSYTHLGSYRISAGERHYLRTGQSCQCRRCCHIRT